MLDRGAPLTLLTDPPAPVTARVHRLDRRPTERPRALRVVLTPGRGPHVEAVVRAYLPPPIQLTTGTPGPDADLVLVWWDGPGTAVKRPLAGSAPLVALCAGSASVLAAALDAGADHALALPVTAELLGAVCRAHARRQPSEPPPATAAPSRGVLRLDRRARTLGVHQQTVHLTLREFDLLADLADHAGQACTRDELLDRVWGIGFETGTNTVDVFIYALRQKLRGAGLQRAIHTVRGVGYRLDASLL